jgi:hypothetical protein
MLNNLSCVSLPANTVVNTASSISATCTYAVGSLCSSWSPTLTYAYNASGSTTECYYTCDTNYTRTGSSCVANTQSVSCTSKPANTDWNTGSSIIQTWNGSSRAPSNTSTYNTSASSTECYYKCRTGYTRN